MLAIPMEALTAQTPTAEEVTDELGNVIPGSGAAGPVSFLGAVLPAQTNELRSDPARAQVVTYYRIYGDGMVMLAPSSRVAWRGLTLEVVGDPEFWPDADGGTHHTEVLAQIAKG